VTATPSTMLELGTTMPAFRLPSLNGEFVASSQFDGAPGVLIVFLCPHCPFVRHVRHEIARFGRDYQAKGLVMTGINSNDISTFPMDGIEGMTQEVRETGYTFPYLRDESQEVARAFRAACTPDFFLFDRNGKLVYRGQLDSSRPGNGVPVNGSDLRAAADAVLAGRTPAADQKPSIGCNIKWKAGNRPDYF
jgi:peroxiredoxin